MPLYHLFLVAVIQGITEFLPISSSGHLILLPMLTGLKDQGLIIDVAVHIGTLGAVIVFFRRDVLIALGGVPRLLTGKIDTLGAKLAFLLMVATVPAVLFGFVLKTTGASDALRNVKVIGWTMLVFGLVLYWADRRDPSPKATEDWSFKDAVIMGFWQAVALVPGTSRSGITITAARLLGYARTDAARLSMLMSIPTILASATLLVIDVIDSGNIGAAHDGAIAALLSFLTALLALTLMMRLLRSVSFTPYVVYRVILGIILLSVGYS